MTRSAACSRRSGIRSTDMLPMFLACCAAAIVVAGCSATPQRSNEIPRPHGSVVIEAVAAENFWGSVASQLGGVHVHVISVITNPDTDPHAYEPTARDARNLAGASLVIENGIGYDPWVAKLLAADTGKPTVVDVGHVVGVAPGANPHRWYNPLDLQRVINTLVGDFERLDPADSSYFKMQRTAFNTVSLKKYDGTIAAIKARYGGTPVGASESIFSMLAPALGLKLITPYAFLKAISEGTDVSVADKVTIDHQITSHAIKIYVYNSQNVTPDVQAQLTEARRTGISVASITETLNPATASYQAWQTRQLIGIEAALAAARASGK